MAVDRSIRVVLYLLTIALAIVGIAASVNALVSVQRDGQKLKDAEATIPGLEVIVDVNEVYAAGSVLSLGEFGCFNSALGSLLLLLVVYPRFMRKHPYGTGEQESKKRKWLRLGMLWSSVLSWVVALALLLPGAIATIVYSTTHKARVSATIFGKEIPADFLDAVLNIAGPVNLGVWQFDYIKFFAVAPWPLVAVAIPSFVVTLLAVLHESKNPGSELGISRSTHQQNAVNGSAAMHAVPSDDSREREEKARNAA